MNYFAFFRISFAREKCKIFRFFAKFSFNLFCDKMRNFREIKMQKYSFNTLGFHENIFTKCKIFAKIFFAKCFSAKSRFVSAFFASFILAKKMRNFTEKFAKYELKFSHLFRLLQTLPLIHEIIVNGNNF